MLSIIRTKNFLLFIITLAVILRLTAALLLGNGIEPLPGTADQVSYHNLALRLLDGHGFTFGQNWWPATAAGEPTAHWSYLYTFYLAAVYFIFGPYPLVARLIQAILVGLLQPYLTYLLGRRLFGERVALVAAALTAVYSYFIYYAAALMTEPFYMTAILVALYLAIRLADYLEEQGTGAVPHTSRANRAIGNYRLAVGLGFTLAVTVLLRQLFLLLIPFIFLWIWWAGSRTQQSKGSTLLATLGYLLRKPGNAALPHLALAGMIVIISVIPFTIYNYGRFNQFVLLNTNAGYAFFWANHPIYGSQFEPILTPEMGSYQALIPAELRHLDEAALDKALLRQGLQFVADEPLRYAQLSLSRIPAYFMFWPSPDSGPASNMARVIGFGLLWPFMLGGLILFMWRPPSIALLQHPAFLLVLYTAVYSLIHLLSWALIRYRLPVDAVLLVFAGAALVQVSSLLHTMFRQKPANLEI